MKDDLFVGHHMEASFLSIVCAPSTGPRRAAYSYRRRGQLLK